MATIRLPQKIHFRNEVVIKTLNEKGDTTLFFTLSVVVLTFLMILLSLELRSSLLVLQKRKELFLCAKETKGEVHQYLKFMGRTNWAIKHARRAALVAMFIPGLQGAALDIEKMKKLLEHLQNFRQVSYLKTLYSLKRKGCPLDPRMVMTPFRLSGLKLDRGLDGTALLRDNKWSYFFTDLPYVIELAITAEDLNAIQPAIFYESSEKGAKLSSLSY